MTEKQKKKLRSGFTTGAAAAASAKGALRILLDGKAPGKVRIPFLSDGHVDIPVKSCIKNSDVSSSCSVIKDAGDDPDITHKAEIGATVELTDDRNGNIVITGGVGVGRVTKPGLEIPPGEPAINPGPRQMILNAIEDVLGPDNTKSVNVEVFVPNGEKLAEKTLNARLGIIGGISILGTTGIVRPMSHDAYIATITSSVSVASATGLDQVVFTTGRRSERYAQGVLSDLPDEAFIQIGDFFKKSLNAATEGKIKNVTLTVFFGKAVKMAQGVPHTHAAKSELTMKQLSTWCEEVTGDSDFTEEIQSANTARHAFDIIMPKYPEMISHVGKHMCDSAQTFAGPDTNIQGIIFDYEGNIIYDSTRD